MKRLLLLFSFLILFCNLSQAQTDSDVAYPRGRWFLGINTGMAWQQADVRSRLGVGWGMTLEHYLTRRTTPYLGWSVRGRFLGTYTWGGDLTPSTNYLNNPALNGTYTSALNYNASPNNPARPIYHNYFTQMGELGLELKVFFNRAWHRSGISPYLFGGIGLATYTTKTDQLGADGSIYDYSGVSPLKGIARENLKDLRDRVYESPAETDNEDRNLPTSVFAPGLGAGLKIKLGDGAALGFEHKITLPFTNLLDGQRWDKNNQLINRYDIHHYSNFWVNFRIFGRRATRTEVVVYQPTLITLRSDVNSACDSYIEMEAKHITSISQIQVLANGVRLSTNEYAFDSNTGRIIIRRRISGNTNFEIIVANQQGSTRQTLSLTCDRVTPVISPPTVRILSPTASITASCEVNIRAQLRNILDKNQISVLANGLPLNPADFSFDPNNGILEIRNQIQDNTDFVIRVVNEGGEASARVSFSCTQRIVTPAPEIIVTDPSNNPFNSFTCNFTLQAEVRNVRTKDQIRVEVNNFALNPSQFNYNTANGRLSVNLQLSNVPLQVRITAQTEGGTAVQTRSITCSQEVIVPPTEPAPTIALLDPANPRFETFDCPYNVRVRVNNVNSRDQISVFKNNSRLPNNSWQWDARARTLNFLSDGEGLARYLIVAQNNGGRAEREVSIECKVRILPPTVNIQTPSVSPYNSVNCFERITANISNITSPNQIEVRVNNTPKAFVFDANSGMLSLDAEIFQTMNVSIRATNTAGTASDEVVIRCVPPVVAPTVAIISPAENPFETSNCDLTIQAQTQNIEQRNQIRVSANGQQITNFNFANSRVSFPIRASEVTSIKITVSNSSGTATDETVIRCIPPVLAPTVRITTPAQNPFEITNCELTVQAQTQNISQRNQIVVTANGLIINNFNFANDVITFPIFAQASTTIRILVSNSGGTANDETVIRCIPPVLAPSVNITAPEQNPFETSNCDLTVQAQTQNVTQKNQISITANGLRINEFNFENNVISFPIRASASTTIKIAVSNSGGNASDETVVRCTPPVLAPSVRITAPEQNPFETSNCDVNIQAQTQNVSQKNQISITANGLRINEFNFENNLISFPIKAGASTTIKISVSNAGGNASDETVVRCTPPISAPNVRITAPEQNPFETSNCDVNIQAQTENVSQKNQISITANGLRINEFSFENNVISFPIKAGASTTIRISVSNAGGNASDETVVRCTPPVLAPSVRITAPEQNPFETSNCDLTVQAQTQNISQKNQISITANGLKINEFNFENNVISFPIKAGASTTIRISVSNSGGNASDETVVRCTPPVLAPSVRITSPEQNPFETSNCDLTVQAQTQNVSQKSQISITANGLKINEFSFENNVISFPIKAGASTTIRISVSNAGGNASDETVVRCTPPVLAPSVRITAPEQNPFETSNCDLTVQAQTQNISQKNQISITANGLRINDFTFENNVISFPIKTGASTTIKISVSNAGGNASDETVVRCTPPVLAPSVRITAPEQNPFETSNCDLTVQAQTQNISQKNQISITANGLRINEFSFENNVISFPIRASASTTIKIAVSNAGGTATDETVVRCTPPISAPNVRITTPEQNPFETSNCDVNIQAQTQNILQKNQISITANGLRINEFSFENNVISFPIKAGASTTIRISVSNAGGTATDETVVRCTPPISAPNVRITAPEQNPFETSNCDVNIQAQTQNVSQKSQISITANGLKINEFSFENNVISFPIRASASTTIKIAVSNSGGNASDETVVRCTPPVLAPSVRITAPEQNPFETSNCDLTVQAQTQNVSQKNQISITANGLRINEFSFENNVISFPIKAEVSSTIKITVSNAGGSASDETIIRCLPPIVPPTVKITSPAQNPFETANCGVNIQAQTENITQKSQILVTVNGQRLNNFNFNPANQRVSFSATAGENTTVKITVTNSAGNATAETVIICRPLPSIQITNPAQNPLVTTNCDVNVEAQTKNIEQREQISILVNGQNFSNFNFANGKISFAVKADENTPIKITVTNNGGSASDETLIKCTPPEEKKITICHIPPGEPENPQTIEIPESAWAAHEAHGDTRGPCPPIEKPSVKITNPSQNPLETSDCEINVQAQTTQIKQKSQISITANGQAINNFNFSNGNISFQIKADASTPIKITVSNSAGSASDETLVRCVPPILPPTVKITNPSQNPLETTDCEQVIQAQVQNIEQKNQISVSVNGAPVNDFSFANNQVSVSVKALESTNIRITVNNSAGSASDETVIRCLPPVVPPTVKITSPSENPFQTTTCDVRVQADVANITQRNQILVTVNGQRVNNYAFNNNRITFTAKTNENTNIKITVTNSAGTASDEITVRCTPPPTVKITNPSQNPLETTDCDLTIQAQTTNIAQKDQISITVGGRSVNNFDFNNGNISFAIKADENTAVRITVTNASGSASDETLIKCTPPEEKKITICHYPPGNTANPQTIEIPESAWKAHEAHGDVMGPCPQIGKPSVIITKTSQTHNQPNECEVNVEAKAEHVWRKSQIKIFVDDKELKEFSFTRTTGRIAFKLQADDSTMLKIMLVNSEGESTDTIEIKCDK
jgi:large repetitive protein